MKYFLISKWSLVSKDYALACARLYSLTGNQVIPLSLQASLHTHLTTLYIQSVQKGWPVYSRVWVWNLCSTVYRAPPNSHNGTKKVVSMACKLLSVDNPTMQCTTFHRCENEQSGNTVPVNDDAKWQNDSIYCSLWSKRLSVFYIVNEWTRESFWTQPDFSCWWCEPKSEVRSTNQKSGWKACSPDHCWLASQIETEVSMMLISLLKTWKEDAFCKWSKHAG